MGYATAQFGKNHVGDRNETLPTVNGFNEFLGNLYHLNAEEEPEQADYPKDPAYRAKFGPRGVLRTLATDRDDQALDPGFGKVGRQTIQDTGALTIKRMETIDDETAAATIDFVRRQNTVGKLRKGYTTGEPHGREAPRDQGRAEAARGFPDAAQA